MQLPARYSAICNGRFLHLTGPEQTLHSSSKAILWSKLLGKRLQFVFTEPTGSFLSFLCGGNVTDEILVRCLASMNYVEKLQRIRKGVAA